MEGGSTHVTVEIRKDALIIQAPAIGIGSYSEFISSTATAAAQLGFVGWAFSGAPVPLVNKEPGSHDATGHILSPLSSDHLAAPVSQHGASLHSGAPPSTGSFQFSMKFPSCKEARHHQDAVQAQHLAGSSAER